MNIPVARDRSRNLEFTLAYTAGPKADLPSWSEIQALDRAFENDLRRASDLVMKSRSPIERPVAASPPTFRGPARGEGGRDHWDALVADLSPGRDAVVRADRTGAAQATTLATATPSLPVWSGGVQNDQELDHLLKEKVGLGRGRGIAYIVAGVAAAATLVGTCSVRASRAEPYQKKDAASPSGGQKP